MMTILPHNHNMWAIIGIYTGREDNIFWRRIPGSGGRVEAAGAKALCEKDAEPLGHNIIHSVTNPIPRFTGAIHVYGGDFFTVDGIGYEDTGNGAGAYSYKTDRKSTRLNSSHSGESRMPSSA